MATMQGLRRFFAAGLSALLVWSVSAVHPTYVVARVIRAAATGPNFSAPLAGGTVSGPSSGIGVSGGTSHVLTLGPSFRRVSSVEVRPAFSSVSPNALVGAPVAMTPTALEPAGLAPVNIGKAASILSRNRPGAKNLERIRTSTKKQIKGHQRLARASLAMPASSAHAAAGKIFEGDSGRLNHLAPGPESAGVFGSFRKMKSGLARSISDEQAEEEAPSPSLKLEKKKKKKKPGAPRKKGWWKKWAIAGVLGLAALVTAYVMVAPSLDPVTPPDSVIIVDKSPYELGEDAASKVTRASPEEGTRQLYGLVGHGDIVKSVSVRSDGRAVVTVDESGAWKLWDLETGKSFSPKDYPGKVRAALFAEGGRKLILVDEDATVRVADLQGGEVQTIAQDIDALKYSAISPDAQRVTFVTKTKDVHILNLDSAQSRSFKVGGKVMALGTTDRGEMLLTSKRGIAKLWLVEPGQEPVVVLEKYMPGLRLISSTISRNGKVLFAVAEMAGDQFVLAWQSATQEIHLLSAEDFAAEDVELADAASNADGSLSVVLTKDGTIWKWTPGGQPEKLGKMGSGARIFLSKDSTLR